MEWNNKITCVEIFMYTTTDDSRHDIRSSPLALPRTLGGTGGIILRAFSDACGLGFALLTQSLTHKMRLPKYNVSLPGLVRSPRTRRMTRRQMTLIRESLFPIESMGARTIRWGLIAILIRRAIRSNCHSNYGRTTRWGLGRRRSRAPAAADRTGSAALLRSTTVGASLSAQLH